MVTIRKLLPVLALMTGYAVAAAQETEEVALTAEQIGEGVYVLFGPGGNIGVSAGTDGVFLIDDQFAPLTAAILDAVRRINSAPIRFVLNTHWHGDHTGGNENLAKEGVLVVAHENVYKRMSTEQLREFLNRTTPPSSELALPVVTFDSTTTFRVNGDEIHAFHVKNAHTDGDTVVHFRKANVIHAGDVYFNGLYPFIDVDSAGSIEGTISAVTQILELADSETVIIPGHGPVSDAEELRAYRDMLVTVRDKIAALVKDGKSAAEAVAAAPTREFDEQWGNGFFKPDRFVRLIHYDLARSK